MAIYHIDIVNGNDANDGLSWATAWKTFTSGATAARIAPGDDIKVAKTAAPTSVGTATWTDAKIGNSITFASAPTKSIDTAKAGWVTMGAGSTVTNGQSTAYMTATTFGGTTVGALQWTTSATANGCYKDLGSTIDYSGYQQICFWFRTTSAFDCTGTQNLLIDLCSDASATTVVTALSAPKWNYATGMWYPIVIDAGSALSSTVRSIRFRTTNTTSQTFYVDEIFASPAGGLTLWSLIGLNNDIWYPIRTIRDADVQLLAGFQPTTAAAAIPLALAFDSAWMGTTTTATTWKLEPSRALLPTSGPATTFGVNNTEVATTALPRRITGGWNTSSNTVDGETWFDNVTQTSGSIGINSIGSAHILCENFGVVRFASGLTTGSDVYVNNIHVIACSNSAINQTGTLASTANLGLETINFKSITGCVNAPSYTGLSQTYIKNFNYTEIWGMCSTTTSLDIPNNCTATITRFFPAASASANYALAVRENTKTKVDTFKMCKITSTSGGVNTFTFNGSNSIVNMGTVDVISSTPGINAGSTARNNTLSINSLTVAGTSSGNIFIQAFADTNVYNFGAQTIGSNLTFLNATGGGSSSIPGGKLYFHNWNGAVGEFRIYVNDMTTTPSYFELQGTDVYTAGSKAVRFTGGSYSSTSLMANRSIDLKLASAAAEANKLVTVTARVKRNSTACTAGIYIPGLSGFLPGYTTDQTANCTSTGTFELLTVTFTPTQNCVFDVMAQCTPTGTVSPNIVWDTLTISQAA